MNRKAKAAIAVVVCVIPITAVFLVYSEPIVVLSHPFAVYCNWECLDEQLLQFDINWPYVQFKVEVIVDEILGDHPDPSINRTITVSDPIGLLYASWEINTPGNYSTSWVPPPDALSFILRYGTYNITIRGNGWYYGGFNGHITVYARTQVHVFIYGEADG